MEWLYWLYLLPSFLTVIYLIVRLVVHCCCRTPDQFVIAELRNQIQSLKNQQRDHLDQLKHELGEKFQKEMASVLADKEAQFQKQMESKESSWRSESMQTLELERQEWAHRLQDREREWEATRHEERLLWQQRYDALLHKVAALVAEKEKNEKSIRQEVEARTQATVARYGALQKETSSLQAVYELRCGEVRTLRQELEKVSTAAAEVATVRERNHTLVNTVEGLQAQLELKNNEERRLQAEIGVLTSRCKEEAAKSRRLSMEKEELQYRLSSHSTPNDCDRSFTKMYRSSTAETPQLSRKKPLINLSPIIKTSDSENNNTIGSDSNNSEGVRRRSEVGDAEDVDDDVFNSTAVLGVPSSPSSSSESPTVRDFTAKNDSVAYVLDLGQHPSPLLNVAPSPLPPSPWQRRRNLLRFSSLRWNKSSSH